MTEKEVEYKYGELIPQDYFKCVLTQMSLKKKE